MTVPPKPEAPDQEKMPEWIDNPLGLKGKLGDLTDKAVAAAEESKKIDGKTVRNILPWVAAGGVGIVGAFFGDTLSSIGKGITKGARWLVTGGGTFEKIPVVGGAFSLLGDAIDGIGSVSGYLMAGVASFLTFKMFQKDAPSTDAEGKKGKLPIVPIVKGDERARETKEKEPKEKERKEKEEKEKKEKEEKEKEEKEKKEKEEKDKAEKDKPVDTERAKADAAAKLRDEARTKAVEDAVAKLKRGEAGANGRKPTPEQVEAAKLLTADDIEKAKQSYRDSKENPKILEDKLVELALKRKAEATPTEEKPKADPAKAPDPADEAKKVSDHRDAKADEALWRTKKWLLEDGALSKDGAKPTDAQKAAAKFLTDDDFKAAKEAYRKHLDEGKDEAAFLTEDLMRRGNANKTVKEKADQEAFERAELVKRANADRKANADSKAKSAAELKKAPAPSVKFTEVEVIAFGKLMRMATDGHWYIDKTNGNTPKGEDVKAADVEIITNSDTIQRLDSDHEARQASSAEARKVALEKAKASAGKEGGTGGTAPATGGTAPATGGTAPATGGTAPAAGGTAPAAGGTAPAIVDLKVADPVARGSFLDPAYSVVAKTYGVSKAIGNANIPGSGAVTRLGEHGLGAFMDGAFIYGGFEKLKRADTTADKVVGGTMVGVGGIGGVAKVRQALTLPNTRSAFYFYRNPAEAKLVQQAVKAGTTSELTGTTARMYKLGNAGKFSGRVAGAAGGAVVVYQGVDDIITNQQGDREEWKNLKGGIDIAIGGGMMLGAVGFGAAGSLAMMPGLPIMIAAAAYDYHFEKATGIAKELGKDNQKRFVSIRPGIKKELIENDRANLHAADRSQVGVSQSKYFENLMITRIYANEMAKKHGRMDLYVEVKREGDMVFMPELPPEKMKELFKFYEDTLKKEIADHIYDKDKLNLKPRGKKTIYPMSGGGPSAPPPQEVDDELDQELIDRIRDPYERVKLMARYNTTSGLSRWTTEGEQEVFRSLQLINGNYDALEKLNAAKAELGMGNTSGLAKNDIITEDGKTYFALKDSVTTVTFTRKDGSSGNDLYDRYFKQDNSYKVSQVGSFFQSIGDSPALLWAPDAASYEFSLHKIGNYIEVQEEKKPVYDKVNDVWTQEIIYRNTRNGDKDADNLLTVTTTIKHPKRMIDVPDGRGGMKQMEAKIPTFQTAYDTYVAETKKAVAEAKKAARPKSKEDTDRALQLSDSFYAITTNLNDPFNGLRTTVETEQQRIPGVTIKSAAPPLLKRGIGTATDPSMVNTVDKFFDTLGRMNDKQKQEAAKALNEVLGTDQFKPENLAQGKAVVVDLLGKVEKYNAEQAEWEKEHPRDKDDDYNRWGAFIRDMNSKLPDGNPAKNFGATSMLNTRWKREDALNGLGYTGNALFDRYLNATATYWDAKKGNELSAIPDEGLRNDIIELREQYMVDTFKAMETKFKSSSKQKAFFGDYKKFLDDNAEKLDTLYSGQAFWKKYQQSRETYELVRAQAKLLGDPKMAEVLMADAEMEMFRQMPVLHKDARTKLINTSLDDIKKNKFDLGVMLFNIGKPLVDAKGNPISATENYYYTAAVVDPNKAFQVYDLLSRDSVKNQPPEKRREAIVAELRKDMGDSSKQDMLMLRNGAGWKLTDPNVFSKEEKINIIGQHLAMTAPEFQAPEDTLTYNGKPDAASEARKAAWRVKIFKKSEEIFNNPSEVARVEKEVRKVEFTNYMLDRFGSMDQEWFDAVLAEYMLLNDANEEAFRKKLDEQFVQKFVVDMLGTDIDRTLENGYLPRSVTETMEMYSFKDNKAIEAEMNARMLPKEGRNMFLRDLSLMDEIVKKKHVEGYFKANGAQAVEILAITPVLPPENGWELGANDTKPNQIKVKYKKDGVEAERTINYYGKVDDLDHMLYVMLASFDPEVAMRKKLAQKGLDDVKFVTEGTDTGGKPFAKMAASGGAMKRVSGYIETTYRPFEVIERMQKGQAVITDEVWMAYSIYKAKQSGKLEDVTRVKELPRTQETLKEFQSDEYFSMVYMMGPMKERLGFGAEGQMMRIYGDFVEENGEYHFQATGKVMQKDIRFGKMDNPWVESQQLTVKDAEYYQDEKDLNASSVKMLDEKRKASKAPELGLFGAMRSGKFFLADAALVRADGPKKGTISVPGQIGDEDHHDSVGGLVDYAQQRATEQKVKERHDEWKDRKGLDEMQKDRLGYIRPIASSGLAISGNKIVLKSTFMVSPKAGNNEAEYMAYLVKEIEAGELVSVTMNGETRQIRMGFAQDAAATATFDPQGFIKLLQTDPWQVAALQEVAKNRELSKVVTRTLDGRLPTVVDLKKRPHTAEELTKAVTGGSATRDLGIAMNPEFTLDFDPNWGVSVTAANFRDVEYKSSGYVMTKKEHLKGRDSISHTLIGLKQLEDFGVRRAVALPAAGLAGGFGGAGMGGGGGAGNGNGNDLSKEDLLLFHDVSVGSLLGDIKVSPLQKANEPDKGKIYVEGAPWEWDIRLHDAKGVQVPGWLNAQPIQVEATEVFDPATNSNVLQISRMKISGQKKGSTDTEHWVNVNYTLVQKFAGKGGEDERLLGYNFSEFVQQVAAEQGIEKPDDREDKRKKAFEALPDNKPQGNGDGKDGKGSGDAGDKSADSAGGDGKGGSYELAEKIISTKAVSSIKDKKLDVKNGAILVALDGKGKFLVLDPAPQGTKESATQLQQRIAKAMKGKTAATIEDYVTLTDTATGKALDTSEGAVMKLNTSELVKFDVEGLVKRGDLVLKLQEVKMPAARETVVAKNLQFKDSMVRPSPQSIGDFRVPVKQGEFMAEDQALKGANRGPQAGAMGMNPAAPGMQPAFVPMGTPMPNGAVKIALPAAVPGFVARGPNGALPAGFIPLNGPAMAGSVFANNPPPAGQVAGFLALNAPPPAGFTQVGAPMTPVLMPAGPPVAGVEVINGAMPPAFQNANPLPAGGPPVAGINTGVNGDGAVPAPAGNEAAMGNVQDVVNQFAKLVTDSMQAPTGATALSTPAPTPLVANKPVKSNGNQQPV